MVSRKSSFIVVVVSVLTVACNVTKSLPPGEALYIGATVKVEGPQSVKQRKVLKADLQGLARPKPNSRLLGIPVKLIIYNAFRNKKAKSLWGKLRSKYGQPPVLVSSVNLAYNTKVLQSHMENSGFFRAQVTGDTIIKKLKGSAVYQTLSGDQYTIDSVHFPNDSSQLAQTILQNTRNSLLRPGNPFNLDVIKTERTRIDAVVKEKGFYYFSPDFLLDKVDTNDGNHKVDMYMTLKPEIPEEAKDMYRIRNVYIYSGYNLNNASVDTNKANAKYYNGFYIIDRRNRFKPKLFNNIMVFQPGDVYNRTEHNITLTRLINLNLFKYVKNRFQEVPGADTPSLDAYYYLTPFPKKSLRAELTGVQRSTTNSPGSQLTLSWRNRNAFRAGEQVSLSAYLGSETQSGGTLKGTTTFRTGAQLDFTFPRFVIPWGNKFNTRGGYVPRTNIQFGYDILNRRKFYTLNQYRFGYGFLWQETQTKRHEFYPISVNYVKPLNITQAFLDSTQKNPVFARATQQQFILGSTYQYNYNPLASGIQLDNAFYFNGLVDISGNIAGLITGANVKKGNQVNLFGSPFSQYLKLEAEGRFFHKFGLNTTWANRIDLGLGLPYGNSTELPFIKQFFVGGPNSLRGFRSRSIGPGVYRDTASSVFLPDLTGDIKLEINTEFRPKIYGPLYGAIFVDAGNVWLYNDHTALGDQNDPPRPGGKFTKNFIKQLAIDAGVGLRVDVQLFVVRLDVGVPIRKPWLEAPENRLLYGVNLRSKQWRGDNVVYNLAIGYPF